MRSLAAALEAAADSWMLFSQARAGQASVRFLVYVPDCSQGWGDLETQLFFPSQGEGSWCPWAAAVTYLPRLEPPLPPPPRSPSVLRAAHHELSAITDLYNRFTFYRV